MGYYVISTTDHLMQTVVRDLETSFVFELSASFAKVEMTTKFFKRLWGSSVFRNRRINKNM